MYWNEICIETEPQKIEEATMFFYDLDILSLNIEDPNDITEHQSEVRWDYIDEEVLNKDMSKAFVKYYTEDDSEAENIIALGKEKGFNISLSKLKAEDWENGWKKYYKTFNITDDIVIVPAWEDYDKKEGEKVIVLDSGMAFGTGTHETTKMCVSFIEESVCENTKILDIGTGSGILSIAASLYGAKEIDAIDIDELAVKIAKENVMINGKEDIINVRQGDLLKDVTEKYDVIIANIVADIIKELIPNIRKFLKENGIFIISGIIKEREQEVCDFALENGFTIEKVESQGGWSAMKLVYQHIYEPQKGLN